jgi:hypothetical protein
LANSERADRRRALDELLSVRVELVAMNPDDDPTIERRPAQCDKDTRVAREVLAAMRELCLQFPGMLCRARYDDDPLFVIVRVEDHDGTTIAEEWLAR